MADQLTMQLDWWPSPAKLNLFLHILGRYDNGYHQLQSLFQIVDKGDELAFELNDTGSITMATPLAGVPDEDNLIIKAANALQRHANVRQGARIHLNKALPMGGGIGGGSSNAATTLVALNYLWQCDLSDQTLAEIGLSLGADVPIFVHGVTAFAGGVGEEICPTQLAPKTYLIVNPGVHVSTAAVFTDPALPRKTPAISWDAYNFSTTHNDCEEIVCERHPEVAKLLQWLVHYAPSRMTGTGACVFATFDDENLARQVQAKLPNEWSSFIASGVNVSPLKQKLEQANPKSDTEFN